MGHVRHGTLPRTRQWRYVVALVRGGAAPAQLVRAALDAADAGLKGVADDPGVVETLRLLMLLPAAARTDDFAAALRGTGVDVPDDPGLADLVAAVTDALDAALGGRTDPGEMARMSAAETLTAVLGRRLDGFFGVDPDEVRAEVARLATAKQFGNFAKDFFARFTYRLLDSFLSKALPGEVGRGKQFDTLAQQSAYTDSLNTYCRETAETFEEYAGDWLSKNRYETAGELPRSLVAKFAAYAMTKLTRALRDGEGGHRSA